MFNNMSAFEDVHSELFDDDTGRKFGPSKFTKREPRGNPMSVSQLKRLQKADIYNGEPHGFRVNYKYDNMYECLEDIQDEWPSAEIKLSGQLRDEREWWIGTLYIVYEDITDKEAFKEWAVLAFRSTMWGSKAGVAEDDSRLSFENGQHRDTHVDDHLLAMTDEFSFSEDEDTKSYVRVWWDD